MKTHCKWCKNIQRPFILDLFITFLQLWDLFFWNFYKIGVMDPQLIWGFSESGGSKFAFKPSPRSGQQLNRWLEIHPMQVTTYSLLCPSVLLTRSPLWVANISGGWRSVQGGVCMKRTARGMTSLQTWCLIWLEIVLWVATPCRLLPRAPKLRYLCWKERESFWHRNLVLPMSPSAPALLKWCQLYQP